MCAVSRDHSCIGRIMAESGRKSNSFWGQARPADIFLLWQSLAIHTAQGEALCSCDVGRGACLAMSQSALRRKTVGVDLELEECIRRKGEQSSRVGVYLGSLAVSSRCEDRRLAG